jgi:hypothetical protein
MLRTPVAPQYTNPKVPSKLSTANLVAAGLLLSPNSLMLAFMPSTQGPWANGRQSYAHR